MEQTIEIKTVQGPTTAKNGKVYYTITAGNNQKYGCWDTVVGPQLAKMAGKAANVEVEEKGEYKNIVKMLGEVPIEKVNNTPVKPIKSVATGYELTRIAQAYVQTLLTASVKKDTDIPDEFLDNLEMRAIRFVDAAYRSFQDY